MLITNSELKYLQSIKKEKVREHKDKFIIEGWHLIYEAVKSNVSVEFVALTKEAIKPETKTILELIRSKGLPVKEISQRQLSKISDTVHSQGIIALVRKKSINFDEPFLSNSKLVIACSRLNDPGNLGTIIRTGEWFAIDYLLLSKGSVSPYNQKVIRSTAGAIFNVKVMENVDLENIIPVFKSKGLKVIATSIAGRPLYSTKLPEKMLLLLGSESHGLEEKLLEQADEIIKIPKYGKVDSLNVAIACGIFLSHYRSSY